MNARIRSFGWVALLLPGLALACNPQQATSPMHAMAMRGMPAQAPVPARQKAMHGAMPKPAPLPPNDHVPPPAPRHPMPLLSPAQVAKVMQMHDHAVLGMLLFQRLERDFDQHGGASTAWDVESWWGGDINRLWLDSEGERDRDGTRDAYVEALWGHAVSRFWDTRLGLRHDFGQGPSRNWVAAGVEGLAPYWFEVDATLYAGPQGRTAARAEVDYDLYFTQRLVLRPSLELNVYGKDDPQRDVHAGLSDAELGLRLRYEYSRRFAPYVGVAWNYHHAATVRLLPWRAAEPVHALTWLAGIRFWF